MLLNMAPKYGNDDDLADGYMARLLDEFWTECGKYKSVRGGVFTGACSLLGGGIGAQISVFLVLSGLSLALVRPLAKKFLVPSYSATNADRVIGKTAVVTMEIDNLKGQGQVSIAGQSWTARSEDGCVIPAGKTVKVLRIEGVKVFVAQPEE